MRNIGGRTGRRKREKKGKRKYVTKKLGKHNTKAHHTKYRFKEPTIIPTQRGGMGLAH